MTTQVYDPMQAAMNPQVGTPTREYWGQVSLNVWACALVKGVGKVPYDPQVHERPVTAIDLAILPLPEMGTIPAQATERHMIAESNDWAKITLQSLKDLGVTDLAQVNNHWARVIATATGRTYEKNGQTREETMFKFLGVFDTEQACRDDYLRAQMPAAEATAPAQAATPSNGATNGDKERTNAEQFLPWIVNSALKGTGTGDLAKAREAVAKMLLQNPLTSKHFTVDSPEVMNLIASQIGGGA